MTDAAVIVLRLASLLALAWAMPARGARGPSPPRSEPHWRDLVPVIANFAACAVYYAALAAFPLGVAAAAALPFGLAGLTLAIAGAWLVRRSRTVLGAAWSLVARADDAPGLVTAGPYRRIRHPIYAGFIMVAMGQACAFRSWPALAVALGAVAPTFAWRALREERLLADRFGQSHAEYRARTRVIVPFVF
jgi:protein-S-isoprenylcysteine O-methyltransferase Ste14